MAMRIVVDLRNAQGGWFVRKDLADLLLRTMKELCAQFGDPEVFVSLDNEPYFDGYRETLSEVIPGARVKTFCCPPTADSKPVAESDVKSVLRRWYLGQFQADFICTPDYRLGIDKAIGDFIRPADGHIPDRKSLVDRLRPLVYACSRTDKIALAHAIEDSTLFCGVPVLFVDVTGVIERKETTGIPRAVREFASHLMNLGERVADRLRVRAVYADGAGYRLAECEKGEFVRNDCEDGSSVVEFHDEDILFFPGLTIDETLERKHFLTALKNRGVRIVTYLHDLFPIHYPEQFDFGRIPCAFAEYLECASGFSGIIANSQTTLMHYLTWRADIGMRMPTGFIADYAYLGHDVKKSDEGCVRSPSLDRILSVVEARPTLMLVGAIAPRKNHETVLDAMELLWRKDDLQVNLVFVGRYGWDMDAFRMRIENHPERWHRFLWLNGVSDATLDLLYRKASGIIYISDDEGFGLPMVEAAGYGKPLLVRDQRVFREVAGKNATYYRGGTDPHLLAETLRNWIDQIRCGVAVPSSGMCRYTWAESAARIFRLLTGFSVSGGGVPARSPCGKVEGMIG